ncbi:MAG: hypothetical protein V2A76_02145 [Planctomycetota bacterium]
MDNLELKRRLLELHDRIRERTRSALRRGSLAAGGDPADSEAKVVEEGVSDVSYGIDVPAEEEIDRFGREFGKVQPLVIVSEGSGLQRYGKKPAPGDEVLRIIIDPIDGTRNLANDMRSAWILTGVARDRGERTSTRDIFLALQSEIPQRDRRSYHLLGATRGEGAFCELRDLASHGQVFRRELRPSCNSRLDNGFYVFFKFSPEDRVALAQIEESFLRRVVQEHGVDRRTLCDDQYISNGGQLFLMMTQRYRFLCDLRGRIGDLLGVENFTSHPYDVCCSLIAEEAGIPVTDADGGPLDVPLDAAHRVSFVAYANQALREVLEPILQDVLRNYQQSIRRG